MSGTRKANLIEVEAQENGNADLVFSGGGYQIFCALKPSDDGDSADLRVLGWNTYFRDREIVKSNEMIRFLNDKRVVELAREIDENIYNKAQREFDPRNRKHALSDTWSKWR